MLKLCKKNLNQSDHMDCKIITIEGEEKKFGLGAMVVFNVLKFNRN
jgi:hypothetical protein